jgi:hypothetical protein
MNITNGNISNIYRNANYRNGISAVAANDFQSGRFNNVMRTSGAQVGSAGVIRGQMPFTAGSANQRFSDRQATVVPRSNENARVFTHQQPNPVQRGQLNQGAASRVQNAPAMTQNNRGQNTPQSPQNNDAGGWRRFGSPSGQPAGGQGNQPAVNRNGSGSPAQAQRNDRPSSSSPQVSQPSAPRNDSRGGWQRFGAPGGGNNSAPDQRQSPAAPRQDYRSSPGNQAPRYTAPAGGSGRQESLRIAPPVVRERPSYSAPSYSAPRQSAPSYSAPRQSAPSYSAPRQSAPSYSAPAPRNSGGGSAPRGNSGSGSGNRGSRGR